MITEFFDTFILLPTLVNSITSKRVNVPEILVILVLSRSDLENRSGILNGRREAFEAVVCQHYAGIYRFLVYLTADSSVAEDLTQAAFASAWDKIGGYKGRASLNTWLHRVAYNEGNL